MALCSLWATHRCLNIDKSSKIKHISYIITLEGDAVLQTLLLLMKSVNKTQTPIFYLLCVICFQMRSFWFWL